MGFEDGSRNGIAPREDASGTARHERELLIERELIIGDVVARLEAASHGDPGKDRTAAVLTKYFLMSVLRTPERPLSEIAALLAKKSIGLSSSSPVKSCIIAAARALSALNSDSKPSAAPIDRRLLPMGMHDVGQPGSRMRTTLPPEFETGTVEDVSVRQALAAEHDRVQREEALEKSRVRWQVFFERSRHAALHFRCSSDHLTEARDGGEAALDEALDELREVFHMDGETIGAEYSDAFHQVWLGSAARTGDAAVQFDGKIQEIIGLRCRIAELNRRLLEQHDSPTVIKSVAVESVLPLPVADTFDARIGVSEDSDRQTIEHAFAARAQMLDFDRVEDRKTIAGLQRDRERLLVRAEAREREDAPRRAEEMRKAQEEAERTHYAWMTKPMVVPEVQRKAPEQKSEVSDGILTKLARIPGRWIRGLVLSGTAFAAIGESAEHQTEFESAQATESLRSDQGGADVDQDKNTEGSVATRILPVEVPNTDHVTAPRETLWKVLTEKIRARGLRVTDEKIFTLKHYADLENPGIDWEKLQIGQVIHLKQVEDMLDQMEGKPAAASLPESEFQSIHTDVSESPLENIPASIFEQGVARLQQQNAEEQARWYADLVAENHEPVIAKAYEDIPREGHAKHVMAKGEWIYKIIHLMLRKEGFNWSVARMNRLTNMTLQENGLSEEQAKRIPVGATISFDSAVREIQAMKVIKEKGKKI